jgi:NAD-dependent deacetylase
MHAVPNELQELLRPVVRGQVLVLTGAGVSAESGIPTFRGAEGFWTVGSRVYAPQEMATRAFFHQDPQSVWSWYLYRRSLCRKAQPNAAHRALAHLEEALQERFVLVTQNVDGLHRRAGSSEARTFEIHGNLHRMRCTRSCSEETFPVPEGIGDWSREMRLGTRERELLRCPRCTGPARPHVLWFDESYNETHYRSESAVQALLAADWLLVVGTSGATALPSMMGEMAARKGMPLVNIDPAASPFATVAGSLGWQWQGSAASLVPSLVGWIETQQEARSSA